MWELCSADASVLSEQYALLLFNELLEANATLKEISYKREFLNYRILEEERMLAISMSTHFIRQLEKLGVSDQIHSVTSGVSGRIGS